MGFPCASHISTKIPKPIKIQNLIAHLIKLLNFTRQTSSFNNYESTENRPSPLLVPLPIIYTSSFGSELFLKNLLPTIEFGNFLEKRGTQMEEKWEECAICLNKLEYSDKMRELVNCSHVFHYNCLDEWVGKGQVTCPLCREDLVANFIEQGGGADPWRVQRIVYLFGEDFVNSNF